MKKTRTVVNCQKEKVLAIRSNIVQFIEFTDGISLNSKALQELLKDSKKIKFISRKTAETNTRWKQIIPYSIISYNNLFLTYTRGQKSDENRLTGKLSIGLGGHINPKDAYLINNKYAFSFDTIVKAMKREIDEEINIKSSYEHKAVGIINDDTSNVDKVHLGVLFIWKLQKKAIEYREGDITKIQFMTKDELINNYHSFERWSQICIDNFDKFL